MDPSKRCARCRLDLPMSAFGYRNSARTKVQSYCRSCQNAASRDWYSVPDNQRRHKKLVRERRRRRIARHRAIVAELKSQPCADCGQTYPTYAMDFDHREDKTAEVSKLVYTAGTAALLAEIRKCDVVCANCHRVRTHLRSVARRWSE